jgi:hypothetical protein
VGQRYGVRPSTLLDVHDPWSAWCVDVAACLVGVEKAPKPGDEQVQYDTSGFVFGSSAETVHIPWVGELPDGVDEDW